MGTNDDRGNYGWYACAPRTGEVFVPRRSTGDAPSPPPLDRHLVKLMNDYNADWPIWTLDPAAEAAGDAAVDDDLAARLRAWAGAFNEHFHHEHGWDDPRVAAAHRAEAEALRDALAAALPRPWKVELDYWESDGA
ncbi:hypothetical protein [Isoptericola cucumis]|uniref:Uncharacterized protein n=1 Tax=Isoptericola cucumis TaxID=1776856 RepID=A0ABQ2B3M9_9MICO|nr:hypothetical protein [Isoptericola cucumis]GGI04259.1 hypothetical protein GCM10007368_00250 [Isoptericola cucumis]